MEGIKMNSEGTITCSWQDLQHRYIKLHVLPKDMHYHSIKRMRHSGAGMNPTYLQGTAVMCTGM
jgi:hypothetical protein